MDNRKTECPSCDWVGMAEELNDDTCPMCGDDDVDIDDKKLIFNEDEDFDLYPQKIEDLVHASREAENHYLEQFTPWDEDRLLIRESEILVRGMEIGLGTDVAHEDWAILDEDAESSRGVVDKIINKLLDNNKLGM